MMIAQVVARSRPEQVTVIGVVIHPVTSKSFTVCINQGYVYREKEFIVEERGTKPNFGQEVELVVDTSSLKVLSWKESPEDE